MSSSHWNHQLWLITMATTELGGWYYTESMVGILSMRGIHVDQSLILQKNTSWCLYIQFWQFNKISVSVSKIIPRILQWLWYSISPLHRYWIPPWTLRKVMLLKPCEVVYKGAWRQVEFLWNSTGWCPPVISWLYSVDISINNPNCPSKPWS